MTQPSLNIEVKYPSERHTFLRDAIKERFELSRRAMSKRHPSWEKADKLFRSFVHETESDRVRKQARSKGAPQFTTINLPYSYALLLTAHTYWSSVFLGRNPIFQYQGRHGEPEMAIQGVEAIVDYQVKVGKMIPHLYVWLLDPGKYGFGVVGNYWDEELIVSTRIEERPKEFMGLPLPGKTEKVRVKQTLKGYQGNRLFNVRPYDFFPDPRVSLTNFQQGEFCGRLVQTGWNIIKKGEVQGKYINIDVLEKIRPTAQNKFGRETMKSSQVIDLPEVDSILGQRIFKDKENIELLEMTIELIPKDWKLGPSDYPEKWVFTLAGNEIIIGARPMGLYHNKFPFFVIEYEVDGYSQNARGMLEITEELNHAMSWLFNSHFFNIRRALNNQAIVDPSRVSMRDLTEGGPGLLARLRPAAYGTDTRTAYTSIPVADVTQGHLRDAQVIAELLQRATGVSDNIMGMLAPGGRKTATEVRTSSTFGVNRLKTAAEYFSATGWDSLSEVLVQNSQQLFDEERQFRIAGNLMQGREFVNVSPELITGFYDFVPIDGTMPIDRFAQANLWKEILLGMSKMPELAQQYDMAGIFAWMAQVAGLKNIKQFRINVVPDQELANQETAGNVIPLGGSDPNAARLPGAGNVGGVGPVA